MIKFRLLVLGALLTGALLGCQGAKTEANNSPTTAANTASEPSASGEQAPTITDAYEYYGLSDLTPRKLKYTGNAGEVKTGEQVTTLKETKNGASTYEVRYTGELEPLGNMTIKSDKTGIIVVESSTIETVGESYELPSGLEKGKAWKNVSKYKGGVEFEMTAENKVEGTEEVKTTVGTYKDALVVTSTGTGKKEGKTITLNSKQWLVKGRGVVKFEFSTKSDGKAEKVTLEETK